MIIAPPLPFRSRRRSTASVTVLPATLTLIGATYDPSRTVTLVFNQPINVGAIDGSKIVVNDNDDVGAKFHGDGSVTPMGSSAVVVSLVEFDDSSGSGITLTATAGNGIIATSDGQPWAGVTGLGLPYPEEVPRTED